MDQKVVPVPADLVFDTRLKAIDKHVWTVIAAYAGANDSSFLLPPCRQMVKICHCNIKTLFESYRTLHATNWLTIQRLDQPGLKQRMRVVVRIPQPEVAYRDAIHEGVEAAVTVPVPGLHNIPSTLGDKNVLNRQPLQVPPQTRYTFPPQLKSLLKSINLKDHQGRAIPIPEDVVFYELAGRPCVTDLQTALLRLTLYRKPVTSLLALWGSFFQEGKLVMKRTLFNEHTIRKSTLPEHIREQQRQAAHELAEGRTIEIGRLFLDLQSYLCKMNAVEERGPHITLRPGWILHLDDAQRKIRLEHMKPDDPEEGTPAPLAGTTTTE